MVKKKWTTEEDIILIQAVSANPHNLSKCFITVAQEINRTPEAVHTRWYENTRFTSEGRKAMLTIGKGHKFTGKNYLDKGRIKPTKMRPALWTRILTILKLK